MKFIFRRTPKTLRESLTLAIVYPTLAVALLGGTQVLKTEMTGNEFGVGTLKMATPEHGANKDYVDPNPAKGTQAWVVKKNDCVKTKDGEFPSGVVITSPNRDWYFVDSDEAIGHVFEQLVFNGTVEENVWTKPVNHHITVGVMCR